MSWLIVTCLFPAPIVESHDGVYRPTSFVRDVGLFVLAGFIFAIGQAQRPELGSAALLALVSVGLVLSRWAMFRGHGALGRPIARIDLRDGVLDLQSPLRWFLPAVRVPLLGLSRITVWGPAQARRWCFTDATGHDREWVIPYARETEHRIVGFVHRALSHRVVIRVSDPPSSEV